MGDRHYYDAYIAVNEVIETLASILGSSLEDGEDDDGPVRFTEVAMADRTFTLFSYRDNPGWSHIASSKPFELRAAAAFLSQLGVPEDRIDAAVDGDNMPLQDIDAIREAVAGLRRVGRH